MITASAGNTLTTVIALVKTALRSCADYNAAEVAAAGKGAVVSHRVQVGRGSRRRFRILQPRAPDGSREESCTECCATPTRMPLVPRQQHV